MLLVKQQEKLMVVSSETCMIKRQYKFPMEIVSSIDEFHLNYNSHKISDVSIREIMNSSIVTTRYRKDMSFFS